MTDLFTPLTLGPLTLPNRVVMAPLTRCRAEDGHVPGTLMATYYAQRASAGLIVAEATMAMEGNSAFAREPGIHSQAQGVAGAAAMPDLQHDPPTGAVHRLGDPAPTLHLGRAVDAGFAPEGGVALHGHRRLGDQ